MMKPSIKIILFCTFSWTLIASVGCKKDLVVREPEPEYQETRRARITGIELTDKDFRQYFIYGENGLLDSVKREGEDIWYGDPRENIILVSHQSDHIRLLSIKETYEEGAWKNVKANHNNRTIIGSQYEYIGVAALFQSFDIRNAIQYIQNKIQGIDFSVNNSKGNIDEILYDNNKITQYTLQGNQVDMPINYVNGGQVDGLIFKFSYISNDFIPKEVKKLINNGHFKFIRFGENVFEEWVHLVYGLSGYELPMKEENEVISEIRIRGYSKEDNSLLLDSTVTFDYQVDTLNRKISFGNQIISYEFPE